MASEVTPEGRVVAPLNITAPAPHIDLKGFSWGTVDEKVNGPPTADNGHPAAHNGQPAVNNGQSAANNGQPAVHNGQPAANNGHDSHQQVLQAKVVDPPNGSHPTAKAVDPPNGSHPAAKVPPPSGPAAHPPVTAPSTEQFETQIGLKDAPNPGPLFPLEQFKGGYAGNGFNTIFRPRSINTDFNNLNELPTKPGGVPGPSEILELNLTTEQLTFGGTLGDIPNRGLNDEPDIHLGGLPYLQTVQDVTFPATGKGDHPQKTGIHFEPGVWLNVPPASFHNGQASVVRMASIPHGTTVNAQGFAPIRDPHTVTGGVPGPPVIDATDTTPFIIENFNNKIPFSQMDANTLEHFRIPQNLDTFGAKGSGKITSEIIKNPNLVLINAIKGLNITETITFEVSTQPLAASALNGGGIANISFLEGKSGPTAQAVSMKAKYWIERVMYNVTIPPTLPPKTKLELRPNMPANSSAPTPVFNITTGNTVFTTQRTISVPGIQIQVSQTVLLNFNRLSWPHVSVSTLVPVDPQPFQMA